MGFIAPAPPPVDYDEWKRLPHLERIKPLAQDWALNGFGTPTSVYLLYVVKLVVFVLGGFLVISATTPGLGGIGDLTGWWFEPIVFQKLAVWTLLWEVTGLGCGSMPLTFRFNPPIGGILYWLRPGTVRLPPWPDRVPLTAGTRRTGFDVALYAGVLLAGLFLLFSEPPAENLGYSLSHAGIAILLALLALLGLRDKVSFLAARPEVYAFLLIVFLFPIENFAVGSQLVFVCIWWGAAASKLNRHFPFVVSVMIANTPWNRSRRMKRLLWRDHPDDIRPSRFAELAAHAATVTEFALPALLLVSKGGTLGTIAVVGMIAFHVHITSTFPLAVPLEWNLFMIFGLLYLFGHLGAVPLGTFDSPLLLAIILTIGVALPVIGNLFPEKMSFLPSMRYYAGNWAASQWLFRNDTGAEGKLDRMIHKPAPVPVEQVSRIYDPETAELLLAKGLAFRSMHLHGRAINGLLSHAVDDVEEYTAREGELISGVVNGWNFGDGHFHHGQLLAAVQERCGFAEGEVRVIFIESQAAQRQRHRYRVYDAASGVIEEGWVRIADIVDEHPWLSGEGTVPIEVTFRREPRPTAAA